MLLRLHSWQWLANHCLPFDVDSLKSGGFDSWRVMDYSYSHEKSNTKDWRRIIAFNRGNSIRIMEYSPKLVGALVDITQGALCQ